MKPFLHPFVTLQTAAVVATATVGAAGSMFCSGCGGDAAAPTAAAFEHVVALDIDRLGSADALEREATTSRGAPGDAEPVLYLVRAARPHDAEAAAAELVRRGFETVRVAATASGALQSAGTR